MLSSEKTDHPPFVGIDHIGIAVHSIDEALPSYFQMGLVLVHRETLIEKATDLAYLDGRNVQIQLAAPIGPSLVQDHLEARGEGLHHLCFAVGEISQALASMADGDDPAIFLGGRSRRACFLSEQPNQVLIELIETEAWTPSDEPIVDGESSNRATL